MTAAATRGGRSKKSKLTDSEWKALVKSGGVLNEKGDTWWPSREAMDGGKVVAKLRKNNSLKLADYEPAHQFLRPKMLRLIGCKKVLLEGVTFQNPPNWTMNPGVVRGRFHSQRSGPQLARRAKQRRAGFGILPPRGHPRLHL